MSRPVTCVSRRPCVTRPACSPGATRPARSCDHEHCVPWPQGQTCTANQAPMCRRHHQPQDPPRLDLRDPHPRCLPLDQLARVEDPPHARGHLRRLRPTTGRRTTRRRWSTPSHPPPRRRPASMRVPRTTGPRPAAGPTTRRHAATLLTYPSSSTPQPRHSTTGTGPPARHGGPDSPDRTLWSPHATLATKRPQVREGIAMQANAENGPLLFAADDGTQPTLHVVGLGEPPGATVERNREGAPRRRSVMVTTRRMAPIVLAAVLTAGCSASAPSEPVPGPPRGGATATASALSSPSPPIPGGRAEDPSVRLPASREAEAAERGAGRGAARPEASPVLLRRRHEAAQRHPGRGRLDRADPHRRRLRRPGRPVRSGAGRAQT